MLNQTVLFKNRNEILGSVACMFNTKITDVSSAAGREHPTEEVVCQLLLPGPASQCFNASDMTKQTGYIIKSWQSRSLQDLHTCTRWITLQQYQFSQSLGRIRHGAGWQSDSTDQPCYWSGAADQSKMAVGGTQGERCTMKSRCRYQSGAEPCTQQVE